MWSDSLSSSDSSAAAENSSVLITRLVVIKCESDASAAACAPGIGDNGERSSNRGVTTVVEH